MRISLLRAPAAALLFPVLLLSGCVWTTRKLPVPRSPSIVQTVMPEELVALLNQRWAALESLNASVEIQASMLKPKEGEAAAEDPAAELERLRSENAKLAEAAKKNAADTE